MSYQTNLDEYGEVVSVGIRDWSGEAIIAAGDSAVTVSKEDRIPLAAAILNMTTRDLEYLMSHGE